MPDSSIFTDNDIVIVTKIHEGDHLITSLQALFSKQQYQAYSDDKTDQLIIRVTSISPSHHFLNLKSILLDQGCVSIDNDSVKN